MNEEKGGFFFVVECQVIKVEGMLELEKSPFWNHYDESWLGQGSRVDTKSRREVQGEQGICMFLDCLLIDY